MTRYYKICPVGHSVVLVSVGIEGASEDVCQSLEDRKPSCPLLAKLIRIPPGEYHLALMDKYNADGWSVYWPWPGPIWLAPRYLDIEILKEESSQVS